MLKKKNMKYVWALFWIWAISVFVACEYLPPGHIELVLDIALAGVIPIVMLVWYYKKNDEGKKEMKKVEEEYNRRQLIKRCKRLDRKCYHRECKASQFRRIDDDFDYIPM